MAKYKFTKTYRFSEGICIDSEKGTVTPLTSGKAAHGSHVVIDCPSLMPKKGKTPKPHPISQKKQSSVNTVKQVETSVSAPYSVTLRQSDMTQRRDSVWAHSHLPTNTSWQEKEGNAQKPKRPQKPLDNNGRNAPHRDVVCIGCHNPKYTVPLSEPSNPFHREHMARTREKNRIKQEGGVVLHGIIRKPINRQAGMTFQKHGNECRYVTTLRK